ncbi:MAG: polyhydroxyalkanoate biosynthesis repressor PhaR [Rhodobacteraceae bacterium]|nr:polyhydroxyalkanoate biosynthesis repressor PhaR [Paracoccaceae bacterium]
MKIGNRAISSAHPPLVIAEIGINHGGDLTVAKNMVRLAALSGCECVKHQTHIVEDEMTDEAKQIFPPNADVYKIGSGEADNLPLIRHIARKGKPVIMSTGMQTIETLQESVQILEDAGIEYALLECTNLYPSPPEIVSLQGVTDLKAAFPNAVVGFSDHSIGPEMALASVALGASILERHYTDTRYRKGPDIINSMDPAELRFLIDRSREIHTALMNPKQRTGPEEDVYRFARASVVADADLAAGHVITESDIWARRPGSGEIAGFEFDKVVGKTLKVAVRRNQQLMWSDFEN